MRLKEFALFYCICIAFSGYGQYQENLPQAKPIPPNAAAMFKVLERPLGNFTGTIPINFPLCGVSAGSLTANVSLDYTSTGGIRVEELSGCAGLGFSLNDGGGRITQIVRDKPDDMQNYGRLTNYITQPSGFDPDNEDHLYALQEKMLDLEPDVFMYNFNGRSGQFFLKENGDVVMMTNDNLKIEYDSQVDIYSWIITDEAGNKYHFDGKITNSSSYSSSNGSTSPTVSSQTWYLSYVTDLNDENTISYTYTSSGGSFTTISGSFWPFNLAYTSDCTGFNTTGDVGTVTTGGGESLVTRIDGKDGYIVFNHAQDYIYGSKKVSSIEWHDPSGNLRKKWDLNYGDSFASDRWRLDNFSAFGSSGTDSLVTRFEYEEFYNLPEVLSTGVDIWGFYNGAGNDYTAMIPNVIGYYGALPAYWDYRAYRSSGGLVASANILKKITYPTGGNRSIEYEGNRVLGLGDFFYYHPDPEYMTTRSFSETDFNYINEYQPCMQHLFAVNSFYGMSRFSFQLNDVGFSCANVTVKIMRLLDSSDVSGSLVHSFSAASGNWILDNGIYRVEVYANDPYNSCTIGELSASWPEGTYTDTATVNNPYGVNANLYRRAYNGGGVRVKSVQDYDPLTGRTSKTEYRYKMYSGDSTIDAGMLASPVDIVSVENNLACGCQYGKVYPGSSYPLATEGGSYVVYPEVRTIDSANGWTDHIYAYAFDQPSYDFPQGPPADYSFLRGKLLQEKAYDKNGNLLKQTINEWGWNIPESTIGKRVKPYWYTSIDLGVPFGTHAYWTENKPSSNALPGMTALTSYELRNPLVAMTSSTAFTYSSGSSVGIRTDFDYDGNNGTFILKKKKQYFDNHQTKEQTYKYAFDNNNTFDLGLTAAEQAVKTKLQNIHYLQPIEVVDSVKTNGGSPVFISGAKYIFDSVGYYGARLKKYRSFATATDSTELNFSSYDSSGNIQEQYKTNDIKEITIWGYNRTYPVAKVIGSDLSTVLSFISLSIINNPSSDAALRTELNKIRTGLAGSTAQVTTYTWSLMYGITSMTDAVGRTLYYEYDLFGRLKLVRDQDNRIVKKYEFKLNNPE